MSFFLSIALGIFSYNFMIEYAQISENVSTPAAWIIFFLSLWLMDNIKPIKLLSKSFKKSDDKLKYLENKIENLNEQVQILQTRLNHLQNTTPQKEMEMEIDFFKKK